jgi:hypothetical protein
VAARTKERPEAAVIEVARAATHFRGCPVAEDPDDLDLAARVEQYREVRPARIDRSSGIPVPVPPSAVIVTHCCECGGLAYSDKSLP